MFPSNKNINNGTSDETFLFRIKKSESDVVNDLFLAIQNIVAGTAVVSNTVLSDTCFQYKIHFSNDSLLITLHYEMKLDEKELLVPVVECKAIGENDRVDDDNNATKTNESFEITLPDRDFILRKETSFPLCRVKQEIPEMLSVLNDIENIDNNNWASFDDQIKVNHSEMYHCIKSISDSINVSDESVSCSNESKSFAMLAGQTKVDHSERSHCIKLTSDSVSNSDASESKLCALLVNNSNVLTLVTEEENTERVMLVKRSEQTENNVMNKYEERDAVIEKKYNCSYCGKLFKNISTKKLHERIHTGEKRFKCEECGRAFTKSDTLTRHKRIHTGEKPFLCEKCGKAFARLSALQRHKIIHNKENYCISNVSSEAVSRDLSNKKTHTGKNRNSCEHCDRSFTYSHSLYRHLKINHP